MSFRLVKSDDDKVRLSDSFTHIVVKDGEVVILYHDDFTLIVEVGSHGIVKVNKLTEIPF